MRQVVSKFTISGCFGVAMYLLMTAGLIFYSVTCSGTYCSLGIVLPVMPWILLLESFLPDSVWTYLILVALNSIFAYFIARYVYRLYTEREQRRNFREI